MGTGTETVVVVREGMGTTDNGFTKRFILVGVSSTMMNARRITEILFERDYAGTSGRQIEWGPLDMHNGIQYGTGHDSTGYEITYRLDRCGVADGHHNYFPNMEMI